MRINACAFPVATRAHSRGVITALALAPAALPRWKERGKGGRTSSRKNSFCDFTATHVRKSRARIYACIRRCRVWKYGIDSLSPPRFVSSALHPPMKLDHRAEVRAHVRARVINDAWYIVVKCADREGWIVWVPATSTNENCMARARMWFYRRLILDDAPIRSQKHAVAAAAEEKMLFYLRGPRVAPQMHSICVCVVF